MSHDWDAHRGTLQDLYLYQHMNLRDITEYMKKKFDFQATKAQYETQFRSWNLRKNLRTEDWRFIHVRVQKRKLENKDSEVYFNNVEIPKKKVSKEVARHVPLSRYYALSPGPQTPSLLSIRTPESIPTLNTLSTLASKECLEDPGAIDANAVRRNIEIETVESLSDHNLIHDLLEDSRALSPVQDCNLVTTNATYCTSSPTVASALSSTEVSTKWEAVPWIQFSQFFESQIHAIRTAILGNHTASVKSSDVFTMHIDFQKLDESNLTFIDADIFDKSMLQSPSRPIPRKLPKVLFSIMNSTLDRSQKEDSVAENETGAIVTSLKRNSLDNLKEALKIDIEKLSEASDVDTFICGLKLSIYFSSNNLCTPAQANDLMRWMLENIDDSILEILVSIKLPTIEVFVQNLLRSALKTKNGRALRTLVGAGVELRAQCGSLKQHLKEMVIGGMLSSVRALLKTNATLVQDENDHGRDCIHGRSGEANKTTPEEDPYLDSILHLAGTVEMATVLLGAGAKVNRPGYHPLEHWVRTPVQAAVVHEDLLLLQTFIQAGGDVNAPAHWCNGVTTLGAATAIGDCDIIRCLLLSGAEIDAVHNDFDDILQANFPESTALQMSVRRGSIEVVQLLLDAGANPEFPGGGEIAATPLQIAAANNSLALMRLLLNAGAAIDATGRGAQYDRTPLHIAAANDHLQAVEILLQYGANPNAKANITTKFPRSVLLEAVENRNLQMVTQLLSAGVDVNAPAFGPYGSNALEAAISVRNAGYNLDGNPESSDIILGLLGAAGAIVANYDSDAVNQHRATELHEAVRRGDVSSLNHILTGNQNMVNKILSESDLLVTAIMAGSYSMVEMLLAKGAPVNFPGKLDDSMTSLQVALTKGEVKVADRLLKAKADVNALGPGGTALHIAVTRGDYEAVKLLVEYDISLIVDLLDFASNKSPLQVACTLPNTHQAYRIAELLFRGGASAHTPSLSGNTAFQNAVWNANSVDNYRLVQLFIMKGAGINAPSAHRDGRTALQIAVSDDNIDLVQLLLSSGADVNFRASAKFGKTALQAAVEKADETCEFTMVRLLLREGADVNAAPAVDGGRTALQVASSGVQGNVALVKLLIAWGAHVNAPAGISAGLTALQGAVIRGHVDITLALLRAGADVNAIAAERDGWTALEGASMFGRLDLVHILLEVGADSHLARRCRYVTAIACAERNRHFAIAKSLRERSYFQGALED